MKNKQRSFLVIFGIIIIFITLLFRNSVIQRSEQKMLVRTLNELESNRQISKLDTVTLSLQVAENNFRMYTALWRPEYFVRYNREVQSISTILASLADENGGEISDDIIGDLKSKNKQMLFYSAIKRLTDSINNINFQLNVDKISSDFQQAKSIPVPLLKKVVKKEEIKAKSEAKPKKFFQRLKSAILNKPQAVDTAKIKRTETITYEPLSSAAYAYNQKQLERVIALYRKPLEDQKKYHAKLTEKEQAILILNERIFDNIKLLFSEYKNDITLSEVSRKIALKSKAESSLDNIDLSGKLNFLISLLAYLGIVFLLYKLYRAYNKIILANNLAAEQVISKSRFFTNISHEMRTPLNAIIGVSEQLKSTPLNEDQQAMSKLLDTSSSMLLSAVNEVLDFSRLETRKVSLAKTPFRYKRILKEVADTAKVLADQKKLVLELFQDDAPDLLLDGDPYRLKQIIMNLTANAIKFTDKGKVSIKVALKIGDDKNALLLIKVTDTGIGISPENIPVIFNEFSQVIDSKRKDWQKGSGLGLTISKKLVDLHKGEINVESAVGKGTTFNVKLPYRIAAEEKENLEFQKEHTIKSDRFKDIHILIVDDSDMNLLVIKMILKKHGISYNTAKSGVEAIEFVASNHCDMVLTDIQMPEMDGVELTKRIRALDNPKKAKLPIIAITGQVNLEAHDAYLSAGLNDYIIKPFTEMELMEKILDHSA